jgi:hypothetical protein
MPSRNLYLMPRLRMHGPHLITMQAMGFAVDKVVLECGFF